MTMNISILCSSSQHPIVNYINSWISKNNYRFNINLINKKEELTNGDILFLISCSEILDITYRNEFKNCLVI